MQKRKVDGLFVHLNGLIFTRTKYAEIKKNKKRKKGFLERKDKTNMVIGTPWTC